MLTTRLQTLYINVNMTLALQITTCSKLMKQDTKKLATTIPLTVSDTLPTSLRLTNTRSVQLEEMITHRMAGADLKVIAMPLITNQSC